MKIEEKGLKNEYMCAIVFTTRFWYFSFLRQQSLFLERKWIKNVTGERWEQDKVQE